jgi:MFS transporter, FSR family, fosmidomycin resistance protein
MVAGVTMSDERRETVRELGIVALVSAGHFWSHFFTLAIPSALPLIRSDLGASNVALGLVMAAFALMAAGWQFPMGVLSDRYGARLFLVGGLAIESLAMFSQAFAPGVGVMIALAVVMGIADSVFHPADYTILTAKIRPPWLGRAYAIHTFSGFLGFAAAPTVMSVLLLYGTWRQALAVIGVAGFATALLLLASGKLLSGVTYPPRRASANAPRGVVGLLLSPPLLIMFLFYVAATVSSNGLQNFGNSAVIFLYELDIVGANTALAAFLWGTAIGVLGGGLVADGMKRFDAVATVCHVIAAVLLCLVGLAALGYLGMVAALFFTGFMLGAVMPARDLMVRTVTPPGSIGKAFGYVSSGFGVGGVIGPLVYGSMMDFNVPQLIFFVSAGMMLATIAVALLASYAARRAGSMTLQPEPAK